MAKRYEFINSSREAINHPITQDQKTGHPQNHDRTMFSDPLWALCSGAAGAICLNDLALD